MTVRLTVLALIAACHSNPFDTAPGTPLVTWTAHGERELADTEARGTITAHNRLEIPDRDADRTIVLAVDVTVTSFTSEYRDFSAPTAIRATVTDADDTELSKGDCRGVERTDDRNHGRHYYVPCSGGMRAQKGEVTHTGYYDFFVCSDGSLHTREARPESVCPAAPAPRTIVRAIR